MLCWRPVALRALPAAPQQLTVLGAQSWSTAGSGGCRELMSNCVTDPLSFHFFRRNKRLLALVDFTDL